MHRQNKRLPVGGPERIAELEYQTRLAFLESLQRCQEDQNSTFWVFEQNLMVSLSRLGRLLLELFLAYRDERLSIDAYEQQGYRQADPAAPRSLKTVYGKVTYVRKYRAPARLRRRASARCSIRADARWFFALGDSMGHEARGANELSGGASSLQVCLGMGALDRGN
jgi:hypothetical protein